jgi:hypothetical protein
LLALCFATPVFAEGPYIWGTSSAEVSTDPGFEELWKYCLGIGWDVTALDAATTGMSHISVALGLEACACVCDAGFFAFPDTIGNGYGVSEPTCTLYYHGHFLCDGDPTVPEFNGTTIKIEYFENGCEPADAGSLHVCLYSVASPTAPQVFQGQLAIKAGATIIEYGDLDGVLPSCDCPTPAVTFTWSRMKALYR